MRIEELPPGSAACFEALGTTVALFNVDGELFALENRCAHHGAPLCKGRVSGTLLPSEPYEYRWGREGRILTCPWHGWQYDLETGVSLHDSLVRVPRYEVRVEDGEIVISE